MAQQPQSLTVLRRRWLRPSAVSRVREYYLFCWSYDIEARLRSDCPTSVRRPLEFHARPEYSFWTDQALVSSKLCARTLVSLAGTSGFGQQGKEA